MLFNLIHAFNCTFDHCLKGNKGALIASVINAHNVQVHRCMYEYIQP